MKSFVMGAAGAVSLLVLVVGVAWAADIFTIDQNGNVRLVVTDTGNVGIGTTSPTDRLHIANGDLRISEKLTNDALKFNVIVAEQYNNVAEPEGFAVIHARGGDGTNEVKIGGSTAGENAATQILFFTAPDTSTRTGSQRMKITETGNVSIGTTNPAASAKLEIGGTDGALLIPRLTTAQRDALTAANGMIVYNTSTNAFNFRENGAWVTK